ncbi:DUF4230 domain-containing protein [Marinifilum fragile]|uniref:DUF4230 domain-containing protein n=1 Tax=Marinifilum fragile TaxID=570161 RepID=UPI0006D1B542|nr:DUF4230 domain-containing protein [Marinifilum fragile]
MKIIKWIAALLVVIAGIAVLYNCEGRKNKEQIGLAGLKKIVKKRELHLIEYKYNDMIFLYKNDDARKKLLMLVKYPTSVSATIDLQKLKIDTVSKKIIIPIPNVNQPIVSFEKAEFIKVRDGFFISFGGSREKLLTALKNRVAESQKRIKKEAIDLGIIEQTKTEAVHFVEDILLGFNLDEIYKVSFEEEKDAPMINKEILSTDADKAIKEKGTKALPTMNALDHFGVNNMTLSNSSIEVDSELEAIIN